jgi:hypothetical protein
MKPSRFWWSRCSVQGRHVLCVAVHVAGQGKILADPQLHRLLGENEQVLRVALSCCGLAASARPFCVRERFIVNEEQVPSELLGPTCNVQLRERVRAREGNAALIVLCML